MKTTRASSPSFLQRTIARLVKLAAGEWPQYSESLNPALFADVAFYIRKRFEGVAEESLIAALLEEAWHKLQQRLKDSGEVVQAPDRYYRMIIKNLVADRLREELPQQRFLIDQSSIDLLAEQGLPAGLLRHLEKLVSAQPLALRTLQNRLEAFFTSESITGLTARRCRLLVLQTCRIQLYSAQDAGQLPPGISDEASLADAGSHEALRDCLQDLPQEERDLIKLRYGLSPGLDGFSYSFAELTDIFQYRSEQQTRNRFYYILKLLRDCIGGKGYYR